MQKEVRYNVFDVAIDAGQEAIPAGILIRKGETVELAGDDIYESLKEVVKEGVQALVVGELDEKQDIYHTETKTVKPGEEGYFDALQDALGDIGLVLVEMGE